MPTRTRRTTSWKVWWVRSRVNAARLVSPEAYWVFTGDDFDLKISDKEHPSYLVIANDPEKEQVIGSLNALVLNRLITRVNSKGNIPVSIIVDELPTLYFHKIDRLIGTARSNKVAVTLGFQELPQLEADYGKVGMQKIITTCGNIFMGAARNKETLEWAQNDVFRQGEADFPVHLHQRQQGIDHHLGEDGLPGACGEDCGYGDRLAGGSGCP